MNVGVSFPFENLYIKSCYYLEFYAYTICFKTRIRHIALMMTLSIEFDNGIWFAIFTLRKPGNWVIHDDKIKKGEFNEYISS
jgi:hypothetical protein